MLSSFFFLAETTGDVADAGKAIALALGIGLGSLGAGIGIGNIFGSMIQAVARQPELRGELTGHPVARLRAHRGGRLLRPDRRPARLRPDLGDVNLLARTTAEEADEGGSGLIEVVPGLMIWTLICFAIAFFVLRKFAFGPIQKTIDERRDRIRQAVEEADNARNEARELLEQHRAILAQARYESAEILAEARKVARRADRARKQEAEAERQRRLEDTRKQIEAETARAIGQIRTEVADLTLEATERVVGKVLDTDDQRRLIEEAVEGLDFSALEGRAAT